MYAIFSIDVIRWLASRWADAAMVLRRFGGGGQSAQNKVKDRSKTQFSHNIPPNILTQSGPSSIKGVIRVCMVGTVAILTCEVSYAAQKTIEWLDDLQCSLSITFDPRKVDEQRLRNTIDMVFTGHAFPDVLPDIPIRPTSPVKEQIDLLQQRCDAAFRRISDLPVVDMPGIEAYRKLRLEALDDTCRFGLIKIRGAYEDAAALRSYSPSATKCSRFIDALEGKVDIMAVWHDLVNAACANTPKPGFCLSAQENGETDRIRHDVLTYGWTRCSVRYLKTSDIKQSEKLRAGLQREFRRRFRISRSPRCSD